MKRAIRAARRDAIRDMLRSGMRVGEVSLTLQRPRGTVAKLARIAEVRR